MVNVISCKEFTGAGGLREAGEGTAAPVFAGARIPGALEWRAAAC